MADVRPILKDLKTNSKWSNTEIAIASCCDEPSWAAECIRKFGLGDGLTLKVKFLGLELSTFETNQDGDVSTWLDVLSVETSFLKRRDRESRSSPRRDK
jgi:hypothetical protein